MDQKQPPENDAMQRAVAALTARDPTVCNVLAEFSAARLSSSEAAKRLGLAYSSQILDLLGMTNLPFPALPAEQIDAMVDNLSAIAQPARPKP